MSERPKDIADFVRQQNGAWFDPGIGGGIHNAPGALHAMRSCNAPFLAMWCLLN